MEKGRLFVSTTDSFLSSFQKYHTLLGVFGVPTYPLNAVQTYQSNKSDFEVKVTVYSRLILVVLWLGCLLFGSLLAVSKSSLLSIHEDYFLLLQIIAIWQLYGTIILTISHFYGRDYTWFQKMTKVCQQLSRKHLLFDDFGNNSILVSIPISLIIQIVIIGYLSNKVVKGFDLEKDYLTVEVGYVILASTATVWATGTALTTALYVKNTCVLIKQIYRQVNKEVERVKGLLFNL